MNNWDKQLTVKGVTFFDGDIDGKRVQSGTVYIEEQMDEKSGNAKGFRTVEYKTTPDVVKRVIHNDFPITAQVFFSMKVTKNANVVQIDELKPLGRVPGVPQSKAA